MTRQLRTLAELRQIHHNIRMLAGLADDDIAASWIQEIIESAEPPAAAPEDVRSAFAVAVELHTYGIFAPVLFSMVAVQCRLTRELALGARFLAFYGHRLPLERRRKGEVIATDVVDVGDMRAIRARFDRGGSHPRADGWRLVGHDGFTGSLRSLYRWARAEAVLRPWLDHMWARHFERLRDAVYYFGLEQPPPVPPRPPDFADWSEERRDHWMRHDFREGWEVSLIDHDVDARNNAAHPTIQSLHMPTWSETEIRGLAVFLSGLWP
jgi:hypothetical protein